MWFVMLHITSEGDLCSWLSMNSHVINQTVTEFSIRKLDLLCNRSASFLFSRLPLSHSPLFISFGRSLTCRLLSFRITAYISQWFLCNNMAHNCGSKTIFVHNPVFLCSRCFPQERYSCCWHVRVPVEAAERGRLWVSRGTYCLCHMPLLLLITSCGCQRDKGWAVNRSALKWFSSCLSCQRSFTVKRRLELVCYDVAALVVCLACTGLWKSVDELLWV